MIDSCLKTRQNFIFLDFIHFVNVDKLTSDPAENWIFSSAFMFVWQSPSAAAWYQHLFPAAAMTDIRKCLQPAGWCPVIHWSLSELVCAVSSHVVLDTHSCTHLHAGGVAERLVPQSTCRRHCKPPQTVQRHWDQVHSSHHTSWIHGRATFSSGGRATDLLTVRSVLWCLAVRYRTPSWNNTSIGVSVWMHAGIEEGAWMWTYEEKSSGLFLCLFYADDASLLALSDALQLTVTGQRPRVWDQVKGPLRVREELLLHAVGGGTSFLYSRGVKLVLHGGPHPAGVTLPSLSGERSTLCVSCRICLPAALAVRCCWNGFAGF